MCISRRINKGVEWRMTSFCYLIHSGKQRWRIKPTRLMHLPSTIYGHKQCPKKDWSINLSTNERIYIDASAYQHLYIYFNLRRQVLASSLFWHETHDCDIIIKSLHIKMRGLSDKCSQGWLEEYVFCIKSFHADPACLWWRPSLIDANA